MERVVEGCGRGKVGVVCGRVSRGRAELSVGGGREGGLQ